MALLAAGPAPLRRVSLAGIGTKLAVGVAYLSAFAQGVTLLICAAIAGTTGMVTVLHRVTPTYDVAAWWYPMRGAWGLTITVVEALSVLASMVMAASRVDVRRRVGLVLMVSWGAFWAYRFGQVTWFTRDPVDLGLTGLATLALVCQALVCARWWGGRR